MRLTLKGLDRRTSRSTGTGSDGSPGTGSADEDSPGSGEKGTEAAAEPTGSDRPEGEAARVPEPPSRPSAPPVPPEAPAHGPTDGPANDQVERTDAPVGGPAEEQAAPSARPAADPLAPEAERLATAPLFEAEAADALRAEVKGAVAGFVDDPKRSVARADAALDEAVARLTDELARRRRALRDGWQAGEGGAGSEGPTTEDRRTALRDYRDLVDRLLRC
ncbi:hypothetical protein FH609_010075 [Streptomyces sp. 3MP-14]|uniref:Uncharacterized protein n=1 Tax=Streptomyces mimosae TaxID=2586635 RepID=A0A5N6AGL1_9ACTN|nr:MULTISPECIES: hypothetical protein [Streptomyces]KAB8167801.1 hypothetical protein FH607_007345 [Streptomyces mimosae]KAB8177551.1 hypothetical protein FH609_010075 [Streptomyces sp. 3MP-14]